MPAEPEHVISPELFDSIDEYILLLDKGDAFRDRGVVPITSPLLSFVENAFAQFFENEVGSEISGFDERMQKRAARARYRKKTKLTPAARSLIVLYEQFCDVHDDVVAGGYGGASAALEEFHVVHVTRLLERIKTLGGVKRDSELQERAEESAGAFAVALEGVEWPS